MSEQRETAHAGMHYVVTHPAVNSAAGRAKPTFRPAHLPHNAGNI